MLRDVIIMTVVSKQKQLFDKNKWLDVCFEYVLWFLTEYILIKKGSGCPFYEAIDFLCPAKKQF